jgi:opacity protein-like surface antigen
MLRFLKLMLVALLFLGATLEGFAQRQRLGFFINAAGYFPAQDNINNGIGSGLGAVFYATPNIFVSLEWKYGRFNVDKEEGGFLKGTLYISPLLVSVHYSLKTATSFSPYMFLGSGLFFNNFTLDESQSPENPDIRKQKIKNGLGLYGGIGGAYKINDRFSLFLEGLYTMRKTEAETILIDNSPAPTFSVNLNSFSLLIGINYTY